VRQLLPVVAAAVADAVAERHQRMMVGTVVGTAAEGVGIAVAVAGIVVAVAGTAVVVADIAVAVVGTAVVADIEADKIVVVAGGIVAVLECALLGENSVGL
jgi:hypothetical protein